MNKISRFIFVTMLLTLTTTAWAVPSSSKRRSSQAKSGQFANLETLAQVLHFVENNYLHAKDEQYLVESAIRGIVERLDKYSRFFSEEEFKREQDLERARALGLGIDCKLTAATCRIQSVRPDSVADRSGIQVGEDIFSVNGLSPAVLGKLALTRLLSQRSGKWTRLGLRGITSEPRFIRVPPPESELIYLSRLKSGVAILRIGQFFEGSAKMIEALISQLKPTPKGLIVDIRGNTGGVVEEAIRISDFWLEQGRIVTMLDNTGRAKHTTARPGDPRYNYPIVVLVDGRTASAAEVLAAALGQNNRAKLVGTQTFGKATIQTLIRLNDGSALRLTVGRLLTPNGQSLEGLGLVPDVEVLPGRLPDGSDRQMAQAEQAVLYPR